MPKLTPTGEFYLLCFNELSTMRQAIGMSQGAIPMDKIAWYGEDHLGLDLLEQEVLEYVIRQADEVYMSKQAAKAAKSAKQGN